MSEITESFTTRSIGPATMSGRISSISGVEKNPDIIFIVMQWVASGKQRIEE